MLLSTNKQFSLSVSTGSIGTKMEYMVKCFYFSKIDKVLNVILILLYTTHMVWTDVLHLVHLCTTTFYKMLLAFVN